MKNCALLLLAASAAAFAPAAPPQQPAATCAAAPRARAAVAKRAGPIAAATAAARALGGGRAFASARSPLEELAEGFAQLFRPRAAAAFNESGLELPGVVARCAVKGQNASRAPGWTTTKPAVAGFAASSSGAAGDYNHYRSTAMGATADRALSILTGDVVDALQREGWPVGDGDLGENVLVENFPYGAFRVGGLYQLGDTVVEITEPIAPCAFLCTLPYLAERWRCQDFVRTLNGRRGWYARVVEAGYINVGNRVLALG